MAIDSMILVWALAWAADDGGIRQATPGQEIGFGLAFLATGIVVLLFRHPIRDAPYALLRRALRRDRAPLEGGRVERLNWRITFTATPVLFVIVGLSLIGKAIFDLTQ